MQHRSIATVVVLTLLTLGIYAIVWFVKTKNEMNNAGASIPTAWLMLVPIVNIWWMWKYGMGVDQVSQGKLSAPVSLLLLWLLGVIGIAIVQHTFNRCAATQVPFAMARAA